MFDIGWTELLVIGIVALIVIGPEDLPDLFRQIGRFTGKMRSMAREFQRAMDDVAKTSGVNDIAKDLRNATSAKGLGLTAVKEAADKFEKWDPLKPTASAATGTAKPAAKPVIAKPAAATSPATLAAATEEELAELNALEKTIPAPASIPPMGPHTQAMRDRQAEKRQIVTEAREKLKALEAGPLLVNPEPAMMPTTVPAPLPTDVPRAKADPA